MIVEKHIQMNDANPINMDDYPGWNIVRIWKLRDDMYGRGAFNVVLRRNG